MINLGKAIDMSTAKTLCTPFVTNGDLGVNTSYGGSPLVSTNIGYPCGFKRKYSVIQHFSFLMILIPFSIVMEKKFQLMRLNSIQIIVIFFNPPKVAKRISGLVS